VVAVSPNTKICRDLLFSYGITTTCEAVAPESWTEYVKMWLRRHDVPGQFAIATQRFPCEDSAGNHRMEIINL
jgi:pyruvate kinase